MGGVSGQKPVMGNSSSQAAASGDDAAGAGGTGRAQKGGAYPVQVNVYEPKKGQNGQPQQAQIPGFGVYHTGVVVHGQEITFAGQPGAPGSGIMTTRPGQAPPGSPWSYKQTLSIGTTKMTASDVRSLLSSWGSDWQANTYHLVGRNCNHFSDALCKAITLKKAGLPGWVNRAATWGNKLLPDSAKNQIAGHEQVVPESSKPPPPNVFETSKGFSLKGAGGAGFAAGAAASIGGARPPDRLCKASGKQVTVDQSQPRTTLQIVSKDRKKHRVEFNLSHTVEDVYRHVAAVCPVARNEAFLLQGGFPPKPLLVAFQTIEEAKLKGSSLSQKLL